MKNPKPKLQITRLPFSQVHAPTLYLLPVALHTRQMVIFDECVAHLMNAFRHL